ncbi:alpha-2-HS-glycoprotein isoform X2 [Heptranchias perlo]|uniref:alpha-2-HS-glycoprotein isoform X2 n=1 Tax=Heptranchias perlo TaxID=212740 RepID=UPI0035599C72
MPYASGKTVHYLEFDVRETKCHLLSHKALKDCEIRSFKETKVEGDCKVIVEAKSGAPNHVKGFKCEISPDSAEDVAERYPDAPHLIAINSTEAEHAAKVTLNKFNQENNHMHTFELQEITRAASKGPGTPVLVEFVIRETACVKGRNACVLLLLLSPELGFCAGSVTPGNPDEIVDVVCELYGTKVAEGTGTAPAAPEGKSGAPAAPEGEGTAPPAPEGEGTAPPAPEGEGTAPPAPEGEGSAPPAPEGEGVTEVAPEDNTDAEGAEIHVVTSATPDTITPVFVQADGTPPKRKRSANTESSESSEEHITSAGKPIIHFPDLPADLTTCPGKHKYPEHQ